MYTNLTLTAGGLTRYCFAISRVHLRVLLPASFTCDGYLLTLRRIFKLFFVCGWILLGAQGACHNPHGVLNMKNETKKAEIKVN